MTGVAPAGEKAVAVPLKGRRSSLMALLDSGQAQGASSPVGSQRMLAMGLSLEAGGRKGQQPVAPGERRGQGPSVRVC